MADEKKLFPLTAGQKVIYFNLKFSIKPAVVNICTMLHFEKEIDPKLMMEAVRLAIKRNDAAGTRVTQMPDKSIMQYFSDAPVEGFEVLDFSKKSQKAMDKAITKMNKTPFPNRSKDVQLYNVKLIKKPDGNYGLYFCVSHLAFDAYALMYMASDIIEVYAALRDGKELPKNKYRTLESYEKEWEIAESEQHANDMKFWSDEIFETEPHFSTLNGMKSKEWKKGKNYGTAIKLLHPQANHINKVFPKELADRINAFCMERRISPQVFYTLAVRNALSKNSGGSEDITMLNNIAKRATLLQKNSGGTYVLAIPMRMNFSNDLSVEDALGELSAIQRKMFAHSTPSTMEMISSYETKFHKPPVCGYAYMNFTYQPFTIKKNESVPVHFTVFSNGYNALPLYLTVMALDDSGNLNFNYDYNTGFLKAAKIEEVHEYLVKFFETALKNPQMTLKQLLEI